MSAEEAFERVRLGVARLLADLPRMPSSLRVQAENVAIDLTWESGTAPAGQVTAAPPAERLESGLHFVVAPTVGVFYRAPEPGAPPFVDIGSVVGPGEQVAVLEAMKLFLPVQAGHKGRVAAVLVENGEPVEYGDPLIALEPVEA